MGFVDILTGRKKQIDKAVGDEPESKPTTTKDTEKPMSMDELDAKMADYKKKYGVK